MDPSQNNQFPGQPVPQQPQPAYPQPAYPQPAQYPQGQVPQTHYPQQVQQPNGQYPQQPQIQPQAVHQAVATNPQAIPQQPNPQPAKPGKPGSPYTLDNLPPLRAQAGASFAGRFMGVLFGLGLMIGAFVLGFWLIPSSEPYPTSSRSSFQPSSSGNSRPSYNSNSSRPVAPSNSPVIPQPSPVPSTTIRHVANEAQAIQALRSGDQFSQSRALSWLSSQQSITQRDEVSRLLNPLVSNRSLQSDALRVMRKWATTENTDTLIAFINNPTSGSITRGYALEALGATGDEKALPVLAQRINDYNAQRALKAYGPGASNHVLPYINSADTTLRYAARGMIEEWKTTESGNLQSAKDLSSSDAKVVKNAADWLEEKSVVESQKDEVAQALELAIARRNTPDDAFKALQKWARPESSKALLAALKTTSPTDFGDRSKRSVIFNALGAAKDIDAAPDIASCLVYSNDRYDVSKALKLIGPEAAKYVVPYFNDPDSSLRYEAQSVLRDFAVAKDLIVKQCIKDLSGDDVKRFQSAFDWLRQQEADDELRADVAKSLNSAMTLIRESAFDSDSLLSRSLDVVVIWGSPDNTDVLISLTEHPKTSVSSKAIQALGGTNDPKAIAPLVKMLTDSKQGFYARTPLITIGSMAEVEVLRVLKHPESNARRYACDILAKIGTRKSVVALRSFAVEAERTRDITGSVYAKRAIEEINKRSFEVPDKSATGAPAPATTAPAKPDGPIDRTWTDVTGSFNVEASLIGIENGKAQLKRTNGTILALPLDRLSEADQAYAREEMKRRKAGG